MAEAGRREREAAAWASRLVVVLVTFWTFVLALGLSWLIEQTGVLTGSAFTWGLRIFTAGATVAAFLLSPALGRRAPARALVPLAVGTGLSLAIAIAFLFVILIVRAAP